MWHCSFRKSDWNGCSDLRILPLIVRKSSASYIIPSPLRTHTRFFTNQLKVYGHLLLTGKSDQFKKYYHGSGDSLKVKYDYMSIMHYGKDYFAKLDSDRRHYLITIKTKDPKYQNRIGQRRYLTPNDILMINTMYGCPGNTSLDIIILAVTVVWQPFDKLREKKKLYTQCTVRPEIYRRV